MIYAADGIQDQITCGPGADIVYADALDVVSTTGVFACPTVYRSAGRATPAARPATLAGSATLAGRATRAQAQALRASRM